MNSIMRSALRLPALKSLAGPIGITGTAKRQFTRTLWSMCNRPGRDVAPVITAKFRKHSEFCSCGCHHGVHTKAEKDLVEFLAEEIVAEKKAQKLKTIPTDLDGFAVSLDGAEVTLVKKQDNETVTINFNINHTVDADPEPEIEPSDDKSDFGQMRSKPNFEVDIVRGGQTLGFTCSFNSEPGASGANDNYNDIFGIDEITLYEGEHSEKVYSVSGEIIDAYLYDLLMNYLEEKGISNELAEKLIDLSTNYEHSAYIGLLEGLSKFTSAK